LLEEIFKKIKIFVNVVLFILEFKKENFLSKTHLI